MPSEIYPQSNLPDRNTPATEAGVTVLTPACDTGVEGFTPASAAGAIYREKDKKLLRAIQAVDNLVPAFDRDSVVAVNRIIMASMIRRLPLFDCTNTSESALEPQHGRIA